MTTIVQKDVVELRAPIQIGKDLLIGWDRRVDQPVIVVGSQWWHLSELLRPHVEDPEVPELYSASVLRDIEDAIAPLKSRFEKKEEQ